MIGATHIPNENPVADWYRDRGVPVIRVDTTGMSPDEVEKEIDQQLSRAADRDGGFAVPSELTDATSEALLKVGDKIVGQRQIKFKSIGDVLESFKAAKTVDATRPFADLSEQEILDIVFNVVLEADLRGITLKVPPGFKLMKPYKGRITKWWKDPIANKFAGLGYLIQGEFLEHPDFGQKVTHTSYVVAHHDNGMVETRNSRYRLIGPEVEPYGF